eukprot:TRINITY_DN5976_c0_g1_i1.p1 TRINITY_DN5976_c0_g1~~TRINITY_DN5976_c0_g1_i1.p1  ORF type:complete len:343 (+),score=48.93 TRINITY_DN5976_c0_g1_i1:52-1080(+)
MASCWKENASSFASACLNLVCSVGIIVTNRWIFQFYGFNFSVALSAVHIVITAALLRLAATLKWFERTDQQEIRQLGGTNQSFLFATLIHGLSVPFSNLALQLCSVGFYQIMKILMTPSIVLLQWSLYGQKPPTFYLSCSLVVICVGAMITTSAEISVTGLFGIFSALMMVFTSAYHQVWMSKFTSEKKISPIQLLAEQTVLSSFVAVMSACALEDLPAVFAFDYHPKLLVALTISCSLAMLYNLSFFLFVGNTSPLTYQVFGHLKTALIILAGFFIFMNPISSTRMFGISTTLFGVGWYSYLKFQEQTAPKAHSEDDRYKDLERRVTVLEAKMNELMVTRK